MKLTTTFELLRDHNACSEGYKKLAVHLGGVNSYGKDTPIPLVVILESNGLDDCLWSLRATEQDCESICRLMACDFAELTLPILEKHMPKDSRPRDCIAVARRHANNEATDDELNAAGAAAWAAARAAAGAAAGDAARAAAGAAAWDAAGDAAWDAAGDAAWDAQKEILVKYIF